MTTAKQILGKFGEEIVRKQCNCPDCEKGKFKLLGNNFKCADIICEFCGFLGQVKAKNVKDIEIIPKTILGAAWKPQKERMEKGFFFPLFVVLVNKENLSVQNIQKIFIGERMRHFAVDSKIKTFFDRLDTKLLSI